MASSTTRSLVLLLGLLGASPVVAQTTTPAAAPQPATATAAATTAPAETFYASSLHATGRGLVYNYERGLMKLTGFPADRIGCTKSSCHASSCDACHKTEAGGRAVYSVVYARSGKPCETCHGKADPKDTDVHVRAGLGCMDCHTSREIHGDGTPYNSAWQKGVMDVTCERCHKALTRSASHTVHGARLACTACHTREIGTCFNCHIDSRLAGEKETSIAREGLTFLVNHGGRVEIANLLTYVHGDGTAITLGPTYPHKITRQGRTCGECHATVIAKQVAAGTLVLSRFENGDLVTVKGVVPVVDGMSWQLAFLGRTNGKWVPLPGAKPPIVAFSGFAEPLTREQLSRMVKEQK